LIRAGREPARDVRNRLGIVPQDLALYPLLTARENLRVFGELHGVRGRPLQERIEWALEWTALGDRAHEPIRNFSGGMKRRLNLACGVLQRPTVILLDEPTVGVDPQSRERIWNMLNELREGGAAFVLTTHQLDEAEKLSDRIVIIDHGRVIESGTLDEIIARTLGGGREIELILSRPIEAERTAALADLMQRGNGASQTLSAHVTDLAGELPPLLERVRAAGVQVEDMRVARPDLHRVFLHLTGRELRE
jgi:ABC-2 type transport system ATP-binding protein